MRADHSHWCRDCDGPFTGCPLSNEDCLRSGSPTFAGLCDLCESKERREAAERQGTPEPHLTIHSPIFGTRTIRDWNIL